MRVVSWNVNGIRAGVRHGFVDFVDRSGADIVGVQEVRARPEDIPPAARRPPGWHTAFRVAERRGYSGVGLYSKLQPVRVDTSLGVPRFDREGRFMAAHFQTARGRFVVVNGHFPKGSGPARDNSRVGYKLDFSRTVFARAQALRRRGPVLVIGDYNTAHRVIDLARPQANVTHSGFLPEERAELDRWIDAGWVDAFRALHPEEPGQYTWWRQWGGARERNIGWRIDYVFASPAAMRHIHEALTPLSRERARRRRSDRRTNKRSRDCAVSATCVRALRDRRRTSRLDLPRFRGRVRTWVSSTLRQLSPLVVDG